MKTMIVKTTDHVMDYEIEEHISKHNRFFKRSGLTLDDFDVYCLPLNKVTTAVHLLALGIITKEKAFDAMLRAAANWKAIDDQLDIEHAA
ncbi:MAG TPA: hypothetical protein VHX20_19735 [Terracidiphilus sp.]|jgi:hypothetical protein|nr:hypothetical protein [Terracidiphilus sp.]